MTDAEIIEQVRSGAVLKYCGNGVVVINYGWWMQMCEKEGFRIVPTPEQLGPGWINVKNRLPEENLEYLVYTTDEDGERIVTTDNWNKYVRQWYIFNNGSSTTVTHWMPLPEPPKEDNDG